MQMLKPKNLAYVIVLAGVIIMMLAKKRRTRDIADIFSGFGILFIGMSVMESAVAPLADLPQFAQLFSTIANPVLGVLVGAGVTAIIQSSSASVGILQALSTRVRLPMRRPFPSSWDRISVPVSLRFCPRWAARRMHAVRRWFTFILI